MLKEYEDRYCLFLDILGFKNIVDESVTKKTKGPGSPTSQVYFGLKGITDSLDYAPYKHMDAEGNKFKTSRRVSQFSDTIVVSYLASESGSLSEILYDVFQLQLKLIHRDLLVRGAITRGKLFHHSDFVFGPALNEAAELEKLAMYPRVIVDRDLLISSGIIHSGLGDHAQELQRPSGFHVTMDLDGLFYVDYFSVHPEDFNDEWSDLIEYLLSLRDVVLGLSKKKSLSVKMKHSWMRQKFNNFAFPLHDSKYTKYCEELVPEEDQAHIMSVQRFR